MEQPQPLRILQIVQGYPPEFIAGTELYSQGLTAALQERGHDCHVLAGSYAVAQAPAFITTEERGISVSRYVSPLFAPWRERQLDPYNPEAEQVVRQHLQLVQPNVIHVHHWMRLTNTLVAIATDFGIPTVVTLHDLWTSCARIHRQHKHGYFCQEPPTPSMCARCVDRQSWQTEAEVEQIIAVRQQQLSEELQLASRLLVPSEAHRQLLSRLLPVSLERFQVVPNCAVTQLQPRLDNRSPGFPERRLRIAYWGYLIDLKGVHLILEAVRKLRDSAVVEVYLAGLAPDPSYLESLKKLADGLSVTFLGEYRPDDLSRLDVDLAVFPSLAAESYGLVLDEAFQLGLPVIVSDRGALAERVGQAGLVFTAGNSQQLAQKIQGILDTPSVLETLRKKPAVPSPSLAEHAQTLETIYEEVRRQPLRKPGGGAVTVDQAARFAVRLASRNREIQSLVTTLQQEGERAKQQAERAKQQAATHTQLSAQLNQAQTELQKMQAAREEERRIRKAREVQVQGLESELEQEASRARALQNALGRIYRSVGWRILVRFYYLRERIVAPPDSRRGRLYNVLKRAFVRYSQDGLTEAVKETQKHSEAPPPDKEAYILWRERYAFTPEQRPRLQQELDRLEVTPLISIVMPVYNPDEVWLRSAIESVCEQVYPHWQLCICDDASSREHVGRVLAEYEQHDERIRVQTRTQNAGIAVTTNQAIHLASGEFVGFLDHDDELAPDALAEVVKLLNAQPELDVVYTDEEKITVQGQRWEPFFKPDWSPDLLRSMNYIGHFCVIRQTLLQELGGLTEGLEGSQDYDLLLRLSEKTQHIGHIAKPLYSWRQIAASTAVNPQSKPAAQDAGRRALLAHVDRQGIAAEVLDEPVTPFRYRVRYDIVGQPRVSILIPTKDRLELLIGCIESIEQKTSYRNFEIIILDNQSEQAETLDYLSQSSHRVVALPGPFNYSYLNNAGAKHAQGDFLLFLNNDTKVIAEEWLSAMLEHAQRPGIGAVGAKLLYENNTIQHAGVVYGHRGVAGHLFCHMSRDEHGYFGLPRVIRNYSAVTAACMMMPKAVFDEVGGFDENIKVAFNDIDLCLRVRDKGYNIVYTPYALLYHLESASRKSLHPLSDEEYFRRRWESTIQAGDPYYSPHLSLERFDCSFRIFDENQL